MSTTNEDNFWEQTPQQAEDVSFFDMTSPVTTTEEILDEIVKDNVPVTTPKGKGVTTEEVPATTVVDDVQEPAEEEPVFFENHNLDDDGIEIPETPIVVPKATSVATVEFLKEKGIINYELEEGVVLTDELAEEILTDNYEDSVDDAADEKIKALPDFLKTLIQVALKNGDVVGTLTNLLPTAKSGINKDLDMEQESNQELVMQFNLAGQGYDNEYIASHIQVLKDTGKLKDMSEKIKEKVVADNAKLETEAVQRAARQKETEKEDKRQYKAGITTLVVEKNVAKGIAITKKDKEILPSYIADATVVLEGGRTITPMQQAIFSLYGKGNEEKLIAIAKILHSDFDLTSVAKNATSQQARQIRDNVQHTKGVTITGSGTGSSQPRSKKSLAELL